MYLTVKQQVRHLSKEDYRTIRELCHIAKNLTNEAIYRVRQYYFAEGKFLKYEKNYALLKSSENYKLLNSNMAQQILKEVDGSFKAFFSLRKLAKQEKYFFKDCKLPHYLPKDGYTTLVIGFVRLNGNKLILPFSNSFKKTHKAVEITIPPVLLEFFLTNISFACIMPINSLGIVVLVSETPETSSLTEGGLSYMKRIDYMRCCRCLSHTEFTIRAAACMC